MGGDRLQAEGVLSRRDHCQRDWPAVEPGVQVFGFEPGAKTGIVNVRVAIPKVRSQRALDTQVIEVQLDLGDVPGKMALHIACAHVESGDAPGLSLCFHNHNVSFYRKVDEASLGKAAAKVDDSQRFSQFDFPN
jgi:hypothetical protein